jgi:hypothetical protein
MSATVPEISPEVFYSKRREKHYLQGDHHRKVILMDECQMETQWKVCQSNPQDLCVPDVRQNIWRLCYEINI